MTSPLCDQVGTYAATVMTELRSLSGAMPRSDMRTKQHVVLPETSRRMKAVRQAGTKPEMLVRKALAARHIRYRLNVRSLPGSPDIANMRQQFAVFVHGCFWHRHEGCRFATTPKTNAPFWSKKFADNIARDREKIRTLESRSFRVLVVWECQTRDSTLEVILDRFFDAARLAPTSK